jgi:hypothetical protein
VEVATTLHGSILHNGWTCNGTHYISLFAAYCRPIKVKTKTLFSTESKLELILLVCSPTAKIEQEDGLPNVDEENETSVFTCRDSCSVLYSCHAVFV